MLFPAFPAAPPPPGPYMAWSMDGPCSLGVERGDERLLEHAVAHRLAQVVDSSCILPAAEKTRSTPADEAGAARNCFTVLEDPPGGEKQPLQGFLLTTLLTC